MNDKPNWVKGELVGYFVFYWGERTSTLFKTRGEAVNYIENSASYIDEPLDMFEIMKVIKD